MVHVFQQIVVSMIISEVFRASHACLVSGDY